LKKQGKKTKNLKLFGLIGLRKVQVLFFKKTCARKNSFLGRKVMEKFDKNNKKIEQFRLILGE
jgi:hypothetical protein